MRTPFLVKLVQLTHKRGIVPRLRADERGTTAIEFGIVAAPFFLFAFAIMGIGLQFFTINSVEHGVEAAARQIRTGQMQAGYMVSGVKAAYTVGDFKNLVCSKAGTFIEDSCDDKLIVHIVNGSGWHNVSATNCVDETGNLRPATGALTDDITTKTGGASQVVLVTACYEWDLGGMFWESFWRLLVTGPWGGNEEAQAADKVIIQAIATFRTEPY